MINVGQNGVYNLRITAFGVRFKDSNGVKNQKNVVNTAAEPVKKGENRVKWAKTH